MPTLLPRRAGFTTTRSPRVPATARTTWSGSSFQALRRNQHDSTTGSPWPRMRSLKTTLSIATALASTPAPVYGIPASSRNPWSVPSSPYGPWTTRKATSIDSARERTAARGGEMVVARGDGQRVVGMRAKAGDLLARARGADEARQRGPVAELRGRAVGQHPAPFPIDVDEIRLEAVAVDRPQHRLGRRHAHLVLGRAASGEDADPQPAHAFGSGHVADELDLVAQLDAEPIRHRGAHVVAERADVGGAAAAVGDDEVRVELADPRAAETVALQPGGLDEPAGVVVGWVAEDAAGVLVGQRLGRPAQRLVSVHEGTDRRRLAALEPDRRAEDDLVAVLEPRLAVGEGGLVRTEARALRRRRRGPRPRARPAPSRHRAPPRWPTPRRRRSPEC